MRLSVFILAILVISTIHATRTEMHSTMKAMMEIAKKASDAEDAVMQVFNDLKATIEDERAKLKAKHKSRKAYFAKHLAQLKEVKVVACNTADNAVKHQKYVEAEITGTTEYLGWIK